MPQYALIGDIGGTNARFALTDIAAREPTLVHEMVLRGDDFGSLGEAARHYLDQVGVDPDRAALAIASALDSDTIKLTNRDWSFTRDELRRTLGVDKLRLVNDFAAIAWAAPHLAAKDRIVINGALEAPPKGPLTLVGAGTGLGVGLLTGSAERGWHVVPTEGGHAGFAPTDDEERSIAAWLAQRFGRVSNERVLSGDGLACIDAALRGVTPVALPAEQPDARAAKDITKAALAGSDRNARRALDRFCRIYGTVAGDAALLHGSRTVMIAGGMVLHFLEFFRDSDFLEAFTAKGRKTDHMKHIAVQVITHANPGLLGTAVAVREPDTNEA
jgi:glucokinase